MPERMLIGWGNYAEVYGLPSTGSEILSEDKEITLKKIVKHSFTGGFLRHSVEIEHNRFDPEWTAFMKDYAPTKDVEEKEETYEDGTKESIVGATAKQFFFISYGSKSVDDKVPVFVMVGVIASDAGGFDTAASTPVKPKTTFKAVEAPKELDYKNILDTNIVTPGTASFKLASGAKGDLVWINAAT